MRTLRWMALVCVPMLALAGCDETESKARETNKKHGAARAEVQKTLLPLAAKGLRNIAPVTLDIRVDETGTITKCLSNRQPLPGCVGMQLENGANASYSFSMEEVEETRKPDKALKEAVDAPKPPPAAADPNQDE